MSRVIRLEQADYEASHYSILHHYAIANGFRSREQVFESIAAVSFAIDKAALVEAPAFVNLRDRQRAHVVAHVNRRYERDVRVRVGSLSLPTAEPPPRTK